MNDASLSTAYPVQVYNSIFCGTAQRPIQASSSGQCLEDYNVFYGQAPLNVTSGGHSVSDGSKAPLLDYGQWSFWGQYARPFLTPSIDSPLLGFGNAAGSPTTDFIGRPRPEGGKSLSGGVGYLERHDTAVIDTSTVDTGSTASVRIDGPGSQEWEIPVDSGSLTISVQCRYDSTHGTGSPPQLQVVDAPELGLTGVTPATAPATADTWSTLSVTIAPTAKGVIRVRGVAPSAGGGGGKCWFDTFSFS
jgi:hypothetical protein